MFRNNKLPNTKTTVNCTLTGGGLGDLLCSLMAVNHILTKAPWINLLLWVPEYLKDFCKHVLPNTAIIRSHKEALKKYNENLPGLTTQWLGQHTPMRTNGVKYAFHVLCDYSPSIEECSYLQIQPNKIDLTSFELPEKYIVLQGSFIEKVKTMPIETFNNLVKYIQIKGYKPVFLGNGIIHDGYIYDGLNLINRTSLLQSTAIMAKAKAVVCMDGGLMHLAGFTKTPIVCAFTFVNPLQVSPIRDGIIAKDMYIIEPDESLECRGCQSNWTLLYNHDFRQCYYGVDDYSCVSQITFEKFKKELDKLL